MNTYVCVLSTDNYLDGVLVINENLKAIKSKYGLLCLINENIKKETKEKLKEFEIEYKEMTSINYHHTYENFEHWKYTFDKLNVFSLTEYQKIVYLDLDLLILENIDNLFLEPSLSMPLDLPFNLNKYNSGIMVIEPNMNDYRKMIKLVEKSAKLGRKISDQNIINEYFKVINPLPYGYNMVRSILYKQCYMLNEINYEFNQKNEVKLFLNNSNQNKIIHYIGSLKPFMMKTLFDDKYCNLYFYYLSQIKEKELKNRIRTKSISIIIPVYNKQKYLQRCLTSVLNQTYQNLEIIIVNDGSTDNSLKICKEYLKRDKRIKLISYRKNRGVSFARNQGLKVATGDYIGFVDSDDEIAYNMYEMQLNDIEKYRADFIQCGAIINKKTETLENRIEYYEGNQYIMQTFLNNWIITPYVWDKLFKKDLIKKIRFDENFTKNEDLFFIFEVVKNANKFLTNNLPLYNYTYAKKDSLTKKFSFKTDGCKLVYLSELKSYIYKYYSNLRFDLNKYLGFQYYEILYGILHSDIISKELTDVKVFISIASSYLAENSKILPDEYSKEMEKMLKAIKMKHKIESTKIKISIQEKQNEKLQMKINNNSKEKKVITV